MNTNLTRRHFIGSTGALAAAAACGQAAEKPLWTAGIVTDTHLSGGPKSESFKRIDWAAKLFCEKRVDAFFHCGDIAALYNPEAYAYIRQVFDREFVPRGIREFFVYHNHDRMGSRAKEDPHVVLADVRRQLKANDFYVSTEIKGTPVVLLPYRWETKRAEALLAEAEQRFPQGPILVFDHMPPPHTVANSGVWGGPASHRTFYRRHPRAIQICGHTHSSLQSESEIYQDADVRVVNAGCLTTWTGETVGFNPTWKTHYGVLLLEVYATRLVFRRFDLRDGSEYHPEAPWTLVWNAAQNRLEPTYDRARLAATAPKAVFPAGAALALAPAQDGDFALTIPAATTYHPGDGYMYRIEILDGAGRVTARRDQDGIYYLPEKTRPASFVHPLPYALVQGVRQPTVRVTPVNFYGTAGAPLAYALTASDVAAAEAAQPAWTGEGPFVRQGVYIPLPPEATAGTKRGCRVRFALDLETEQEETTGMSFDMVVADGHRQLRPWLLMAVAPGKPGVLRYVFDVIAARDGDPFEIKCGGLNGRRLFNVRRVAVY